jgi:hypothetical protein
MLRRRLSVRTVSFYPNDLVLEGCGNNSGGGV